MRKNPSSPSPWVSREKLFLFEDLRMAFSFDAIILTQLEKANILFLHSKISLGFAQEKGLYVEFLCFFPLFFSPFFFPWNKSPQGSYHTSIDPFRIWEGTCPEIEMLSANSWRSWNGLKIDFSFAWRSANRLSFTNMKWESDKDNDSKKKSVFRSWDSLSQTFPPAPPYYPYPFQSHLIHQIHI